MTAAVAEAGEMAAAAQGGRGAATKAKGVATCTAAICTRLLEKPVF